MRSQDRALHHSASCGNKMKIFIATFILHYVLLVQTAVSVYTRARIIDLSLQGAVKNWLRIKEIYR